MKWSIMCDKKFTIRQILDEPEEAFDAVMEIESRYQTMVQIVREQNG